MKSVKFFAIFALMLPAMASADPIHVYYEGTVYSGNGGYSYGDTITGYFDFDTDDMVSSAGTYSCGYGYGPVTSSAGGSHTNNGDYTVNCDNYYGSYFDQLFVRDHSHGYSNNYKSYDYVDHYINVYDYYGDSLQGNWSDAWYESDDLSGMDSARGFIWTYGYDYSNSSENGSGSYSSYAYFDLTSLHISSKMKVSEPGTMALFGLGLIGLGFARRRKVN